MAFLWGLEDGSVNTHCLEMLGFEFEDNTEPFSIFSMFEAFAVFFFQILQSFVDPGNKSTTDQIAENYFIYVAITGILGAFMCGTTYFFDFRKTHSNENNNQNSEANGLLKLSENTDSKNK